MSEPRDEPRKQTATTGNGVAPPPQVAAASGWRTVAIALAVALLLVVGLAATAVLWLYGQPWTPTMPPPDPRLDRPEAAQQQSQRAEAVPTAALQRLDGRVAALEAKPAAPPGDLAEIRQEVARLAAAAAELTTRIDSVDKEVHGRAASDLTDIALVLALLQIRDAIEAGRPFAAAYEALVALAQGRAEIAAAAAPLAEPARAGLPGRPVLASRLHELAGALAAADASPTAPANTDAPDWTNQALRRLSGLVTIRRIDGSGQGQQGGGPHEAVNAALQALAGGDLEGAVGALDKLTGAPAETARPWLRMAKERLAAEAALQQIEALLVARLGAPVSAQSGSGPPR